MLESVARHEAVRVAMIGRLGLWAVVLAIRPRVGDYPHQTLRAVATKALHELLSNGHIVLYTTPWWSTKPHVLGAEEIEPALAEECHWRPRQTSSRRLVRVALTQAGAEAFRRGEFGSPARPVASDVYSLPDPIGAIAAMEDNREKRATLAAGAVVGAICGMFIPLISIFLGISVHLFVVWLFVMLGAGIGAALAYQNEGYAGISPSDVTDDQEDGPSLDPFDRFGDPRF